MKSTSKNAIEKIKWFWKLTNKNTKIRQKNNKSITKKKKCHYQSNYLTNITVKG